MPIEPAENHRQIWSRLSRQYPTYRGNPDTEYEKRVDAEQEEARELMENSDMPDEPHFGQG